VHCTKISPEFECHGQRSKVKVIGDKKNENVRATFCSGVVLWGAVDPRAAFFREPSSGPLLRLWENQRMLSNSYVYISPLNLRLTTFVPLCCCNGEIKILKILIERIHQ